MLRAGRASERPRLRDLWPPELLANFWQNGFLMTSPLEGESENCLVFIGDLMVGLGGLEPPTSPLSGRRPSQYLRCHQRLRGRGFKQQHFYGSRLFGKCSHKMIPG